MKRMKFLAGLLAGLSVVLGSWGLVACDGFGAPSNSSSSSSSESSSEDAQPKGVVYEVVDGTAQVVSYEGTDENVVIEATYNGVAVTKIGNNAFRDGTFTSVVIPDSVTEIGNSAFYGCRSLENVEIPDSVTSIGLRAFSMCDGLMSIVIGENVASIGDSVFDGANVLSSVSFNGTKSEWEEIEKNTATWWTIRVPTEKVVCSDGEVDL